MIELQKFEDQMKKVIERVKTDFSALRTGRAHLSMLEGIKVDYYGSTVPIPQLGTISILEGRTFEIKPWDKESLKAIEQAIIKSDLGISPLNDGKILRVSLPALTEERRKDLVRVIKKQSEEYRVAIRNVRRESVESFKNLEKEKKISKDELFKMEQTIQKLTDHYVKTVDELLAHKEKEILEV